MVHYDMNYEGGWGSRLGWLALCLHSFFLSSFVRHPPSHNVRALIAKIPSRVMILTSILTSHSTLPRDRRIPCQRRASQARGERGSGEDGCSLPPPSSPPSSCRPSRHLPCRGNLRLRRPQRLRRHRRVVVVDADGTAPPSRPLVAPAGCCVSPLSPYCLALPSSPLIAPAG